MRRLFKAAVLTVVGIAIGFLTAWTASAIGLAIIGAE
jgi:hypothetical protein